MTLLPMEHSPTAHEITLLAGVGIGIADGGGGVVVGIPIGTDAFVQEHAIKMVKEKGAEGLGHLLARVPDKQASIVHRDEVNSTENLLPREGDAHRSL